MDKVLRIKDLCLSIQNDGKETMILDHLNFELNENEVLGLLGPSGSGKSMTLKAIIRLFEHLNVQYFGSIICDLDGTEVDILSTTMDTVRRIRKEKISYLFQHSSAVLNPGMRVIDQLIESNRGDKDPREKALELLEQTNLVPVERFAQSYPRQLSGGQIQRVLIAMSLMSDPQILLADEPNSALDEETQKDIISLLLKFQKEKELSIILVSHDLELINDVCHRHLNIKAGRLTDSTEFSESIERDSFEAAVQSGPPILSLKNIAKSFSTSNSFIGATEKLTVLENFDLDIHAGEIVGLVGKSGSGKSTIGNILAMLESYDDGSYIFKGTDVHDMKASDMQSFKKACQIIFQDSFSAMTPHISVRQFLKEAIELHSLGDAADLIPQKLNEVGLEMEIIDRLPGQISGGQRQRVLIARALMMSPDILICDEILSSLDSKNASRMLKLLLRIRKAYGMAILFISHDMKHIQAISDRIVSIE